MPLTYVLPDSFLQDYSKIRSTYETDSKVGSLDNAKQPMFTRFGATDVKTRKSQIVFLEGLHASVEDKLRPELTADSTEAEVRNHVSALRILLAGCLYVKAQIAATYTYPNDESSSKLGKLINQLLKLSCDKRDDNVIDEETRAAVLLTAEQFLSNRNVFISESETSQAKIDEKSWAGFREYLKKETALLSKEYSDYPCRDFMVPVCAAVLGAAGGATGWVLGDALSKSSLMLSTRNSLTAALGSGLICLMGPTAHMGVIVLVPTIAGRMLDTFCGLSLGYVLGAAMGMAGYGLGWGVGMGMDLGVKLLQKGCHGLANCYYGDARLPNITGITLVNSTRVTDGVMYQAEANFTQLDIIYEETPGGVKFKCGEEEGLIPWDFKQTELMANPFIQKLQSAMQHDTSGLMPKIEQPEVLVFDMSDEEEGTLVFN